eukprot:1085406-Pyramimonas_sp.AAC.1
MPTQSQCDVKPMPNQCRCDANGGFCFSKHLKMNPFACDFNRNPYVEDLSTTHSVEGSIGILM